MELILIELLLWAGLIFFFWALRDGLNHIKCELESQGPDVGESSVGMSRASFDRAEKVIDPIGQYRDAPIYHYAIIDGKSYQFKHILPWESFSSMQKEERCLAPGLVYTRCEEGELKPT